MFILTWDLVECPDQPGLLILKVSFKKRFHCIHVYLLVANLGIEMILTQPVVIYCEFIILLYTHEYVTISTNTCIFICLVKDNKEEERSAKAEKIIRFIWDKLIVVLPLFLLIGLIENTSEFAQIISH